MEILTFEQGSPEWFAARAGIPTASEFHTVLAKGQGGGDSKTRRTYLHKLAGEILTGEPSEGYSNHHMERGHVMEPDARNLYAFMHDVEPEQVGFIRSGRKGCSPDSLIGDVGMLEIKTKQPHLLIDSIFREGPPPEHTAQLQGALWVAEREWIDLAIYWPRMPLVVHRVTRDEAYIMKLVSAVAAFVDELDEIVERVRRYGDQGAAA